MIRNFNKIAGKFLGVGGVSLLGKAAEAFECIAKLSLLPLAALFQTAKCQPRSWHIEFYFN